VAMGTWHTHTCVMESFRNIFFNEEVFKPSLKVYMYIPASVAEDMINVLKQAKYELFKWLCFYQGWRYAVG